MWDITRMFGQILFEPLRMPKKILAIDFNSHKLFFYPKNYL